VALAVALSYVFTLAAFYKLALLVGREGFDAEPPRLTWQFVATFLGGTVSFALIQLTLLYCFRPRNFWPQGWAKWLKCLWWVVCLQLAVAAQVPVGDGFVIAGAFTLALGVGFGVVPTLLCIRDWRMHLARAARETTELRRVDNWDLPRSIRRYFESHTPAVIELGFEPIGDFRVKQYSVEFVRFFLHRDSDTFAEISYFRSGFFRLRATSFVSLSPEGHYLESSNAQFGSNKYIRNFEMQVFPQLSLEATFERHRSRLREVDQGMPRKMQVDDLSAVITYGLKYLYKLLISEGRARMNPYAYFDESTLVVSNGESVKPVAPPLDMPCPPSLTEV
jgi:hypothetical protein